MWRDSSTTSSIQAKTDWQIAAIKQRDNIARNGGAYRDGQELVNQQQRQLAEQYGAKSDRLGVIFSRFLVSTQSCFGVLIPAKSQFPQDTKVVG